MQVQTTRPRKLVDSGFITLLRFSCRARRLAWSWKDSLGWDWLCSSSKRSGVAVGSQVTKRPERHTEVDRAYGGKPGNSCRAFSFRPLTLRPLLVASERSPTSSSVTISKISDGVYRCPTSGRGWALRAEMERAGESPPARRCHSRTSIYHVFNSIFGQSPPLPLKGVFLFPGS